jgi:hypothetical protein
MAWDDILLQILDASVPITEALASGQLTADNLWTNPAVEKARDKLVGILTREGTIDSMIEASQKLRAKHRQLMDKDPLTVEELRALGVLSGAAYALSADALARAVTPQAIFFYTIHKLIPWIQRIVKLADVIARSRDLDDLTPETDLPEGPAALAGPDRAQLRELITILRSVVRLLEKQL